VPGCDERVGKGAVVWPCVGDANHDGPHWANEHAPSVVQHQRWEAGQRHGVADTRAEQLPLFTTEVTEPEREQTAREILEQFQGTPQTFWERNGLGDEYPAPQVKPDPVSKAVPSSQGPMGQAAVLSSLESATALVHAAMEAVREGDMVGAKVITKLARSTLGALHGASWDEATVTQS